MPTDKQFAVNVPSNCTHNMCMTRMKKLHKKTYNTILYLNTNTEQTRKQKMHTHLNIYILVFRVRFMYRELRHTIFVGCVYVWPIKI